MQYIDPGEQTVRKFHGGTRKINGTPSIAMPREVPPDFSLFLTNKVSTLILRGVFVHIADSSAVISLELLLAVTRAPTGVSVGRNAKPVRAGGANRCKRLAGSRYVRHPLPSQVRFLQKRLSILFV